MRPTETIALRREPGHLIRSLVALLLRGGLGMVFLASGLHKLDDLGRVGADEPPPPAGAEVELLDDPEAEFEAFAAEEAAADEEPDEDDEPGYPDSIRAMFADTFVARDMEPALELFLTVLPYVEVALGALLIVGLFTTLTAFLGGLLLLNLTFGWAVKQETGMYPDMLIYLLVDAGILWLSPITSNYLSLDGLLFGWFWKPKDEGEFRKEYEAPVR
jgi:uncharacterized membrane protein YphA (DoxX/SURF4 family)